MPFQVEPHRCGVPLVDLLWSHGLLINTSRDLLSVSVIENERKNPNSGLENSIMLHEITFPFLLEVVHYLLEIV